MGFNVGDKVVIVRAARTPAGWDLWVPEMDEYLNNGKVHEVQSVSSQTVALVGVTYVFSVKSVELAGQLFHTGEEG